MGDQDSGGTCQTDMIERRRIPASRSRLYRPALVAAGIGLLLSLAGASAVGQWEERVTKAEFEGVAEDVQAPGQQRVDPAQILLAAADRLEREVDPFSTGEVAYGFDRVDSIGRSRDGWNLHFNFGSLF